MSRTGVGNYFDPRATLRLIMGPLGQISVKKTNLKLKNCLSRAVHMLPSPGLEVPNCY